VIREHILLVFHGSGANGKSTLVNCLLDLLGEDYATKMPRDMLVVSRQSQHATREASLFGKRFCSAMETEDGQALSEGLVKDLTGGDKIMARRMKEDFWQFDPTHKLCLATNHKPIIRGGDHGIWRRLKLVPFDRQIPESEQDTELGDKLKSELSGILNWAIAGCLSWQKSGLVDPECVRVATADYRSQSDDIGQFIADHCVVGPAFLVPAKSLFECYRENGGDMTQTAFGRSMAERFEKQRMTHGSHRNRTCYRGIGLTSDEDE
jgi:putative DNA primase/helicase